MLTSIPINLLSYYISVMRLSGDHNILARYVLMKRNSADIVPYFNNLHDLLNSFYAQNTTDSSVITFNFFETPQLLNVDNLIEAAQACLSKNTSSLLYAKTTAYGTAILCLKCLAVFLVVVLVRVTIPKYKMETISKMGWLYNLIQILAVFGVIALCIIL